MLICVINNGKTHLIASSFAPNYIVGSEVFIHGQKRTQSDIKGAANFDGIARLCQDGRALPICCLIIKVPHWAS